MKKSDARCGTHGVQKRRNVSGVTDAPAVFPRSLTAVLVRRTLGFRATLDVLRLRAMPKPMELAEVAVAFARRIFAQIYTRAAAKRAQRLVTFALSGNGSIPLKMLLLRG